MSRQVLLEQSAVVQVASVGPHGSHGSVQAGIRGLSPHPRRGPSPRPANRDRIPLEVRKEIVENGGSFKAFREGARKRSKDVSTKRTGGALGWFARGKMARELSEAAFSMKPEQISRPVKTEYGWHLIFLEDRRGKN